MEGYGYFKFADGKSYEGFYKSDKKHGYGIFTWLNGKRYEGWWVEGKQQGYGILADEKRKQYGLWKDGQKASVFKQDEIKTIMEEY
jgi:hypothetical protein